MLKSEIKTGMDYLCEDIGKLCLFAVCAYSAFVVVSSIISSGKDDDYQDRLRKAYEGLSPEEY